MAKAANTNKRGTAAKAAKSATRGKPAAKKKPATKAKPAAKAKKPAPKPPAKRGKPAGAAKKRPAAVVSRGKGGAKAAAKSRPVKPAAKGKVVAKAKPAPKTRPVAKARPAAKKAPVAQRQAATKRSAGKTPAVARPAKHVAAPKVAAPKAVAPVAAPPPSPSRSGGKVAVAVAVAPPKMQTPLNRHLRKTQKTITVKGNEVVRPTLPAGYKPTAKEPYMGPLQVEYFRQKLNKWRTDLVEESKQTIDNLRDEVRDVGDEAERATRETENSLELRTRDRYRKLISKIDKALRRIEEGEYGYCEETGEEIGLDRLGARPIATLCLDAQERWEHRQRQMGD